MRLKRYAIICHDGYNAEFRYLKKRMPYLLRINQNNSNDFMRIQEEILKSNKMIGETRYWYIHLYLWEKATRNEMRKPKFWNALVELESAITKLKNGRVPPIEGKSILSKHLTPFLHKYINCKLKLAVCK